MKAGWESARLADICSKVTQGPNPKYDKNGNDRFRVLKTKDLYDAAIHYERADSVSEEVFSNHHSAELRNGDVLLAIVGQGSINKCNVFETQDDVRFIFTRALGLIRPDPTKLNSHFLMHFLQSSLGKELIDAGIGGTSGQQVVTSTHLKALPIPLPPLKEQQRIVAVLDEAFEGLTRARTHTEANLQNARELFDEVVNACFAKANANDGEATILGALAQFRNGLNYTRTSAGRSVKIVGVGDFKDHFTVPVDTLSAITIDGELADNDELHAGDIVAVRSNGNRELIGRTMLVPSLSDQVSFSGFTIRIRLTTDKLLPEYLCEYMRTKKARRTLIDGGGGSNISNLNQGLLSSLPIRFPDLAAQRDALYELDLARSQSIGLVHHYETKLQSIDALRQSLLQKAFAGELT